MTQKPKAKTAAPPKKPRHDKLTKYLSRPLILEESAPPRALGQLLSIICVLFFSLIAWATVSTIGEVAIADGQVNPAGAVQGVQHFEGGIIAEILVDDGAVVEAGQALLRLDAAIPLAELEQLRARQISLSLQAERLQAFSEDRPAKFSAYPGFEDQIAIQSSILTIQRQAAVSQRQVLDARVKQRNAEQIAMANQITSLNRQAEILREQADVRAGLLKKGLVSRLVYLETERAFANIQGQIAGVSGDLASAREAVAEATISVVEFEATRRGKILEELGAVSAELAQVREAVGRRTDRVSRLDVVAPTAGIIQAIKVNTIGGVIAPGEVLMEILPVEDTMVAEVRISPRDIGHVNVGQAATLKVTAYDPTRFGSISGSISQISPSTLVSDDGQPYYRATIDLNSTTVGDDPVNRILPGMIVSAEIKTGSKTILQYLASPVFRALRGSFRER